MMLANSPHWNWLSVAVPAENEGQKSGMGQVPILGQRFSVYRAQESLPLQTSPTVILKVYAEYAQQPATGMLLKQTPG
jgi:hypothetical protein